MAIGPSALTQLRTKADGEKIKKLEEKIDEHLKKQFKGKGSISYRLPKEYTPNKGAYLEALLERYRQEGFDSVKVVKRYGHWYGGFQEEPPAWYVIRFEYKGGK